MNQELKIKLYSYDHKLIDSSIKKIVDVAKTCNVEFKGPIPLPTKKEIITILRSPHVNKSSREQFERRTHKRLIIIVSPSPEFVSKIKSLMLPAGVNIKVKK